MRNYITNDHLSEPSTAKIALNGDPAITKANL
jgi:hypothetical protein